MLLSYMPCIKMLDQPFFFFFFFAFPSYISGVHHFLGEIFAYVTGFFLIQPLR